MSMPDSTVARKIFMAVTGQMLVLYVVLHVAGNSTIYFSKLNAYAAGLHALPLLLWPVRLAMLCIVLLHIFYGIVITLENASARPVAYAKKVELASTFAGRNMIWSGAVIGTFIVYHLLHFTIQAIDPATAAITNLDAAGRPDVFLMVARAFQRTGMVILYLIGVAGLWFHLSHGIQSSFQTLGLNGDRSFPHIKRGGTLAAWVLLAAYASIPLAIFTGLLLR